MNDFLAKRMQHILQGRPLKQKEYKPIAKISEKRKAKLKEQKSNEGESGLDKYFEHHMINSIPKCENCGLEAHWLVKEYEDKKQQEAYRLMWRASQAHVLAKKDNFGGFPSVSTNLSNHLVLFPSWGGYLCGCHDEFDSSYEKAAMMPIFKKAADIVQSLYPLLSHEEKSRLPEIYIQEIKPEIYNTKLKS